jgi:hypothetical protein
MRVAHKKPKSSAHFWMGCPRGLDTNDVDLELPKKTRINSISASGAPMIPSTLGPYVLAALALRGLLDTGCPFPLT